MVHFQELNDHVFTYTNGRTDVAWSPLSCGIVWFFNGVISSSSDFILSLSSAKVLSRFAPYFLFSPLIVSGVFFTRLDKFLVSTRNEILTHKMVNIVHVFIFTKFWEQNNGKYQLYCWHNNTQVFFEMIYKIDCPTPSSDWEIIR